MAPKDVETVRDYMLREQESAVPLAAYELGISVGRAAKAFKELEERGIIAVAAPAIRGRDGGPAVFAYQPIDKRHRATVTRLPLPELDAALRPDLKMAVGETVPLTGKPKGPAHRPGRQPGGHRIKRQKTKGHT